MPGMASRSAPAPRARARWSGSAPGLGFRTRVRAPAAPSARGVVPRCRDQPGHVTHNMWSQADRDVRRSLPTCDHICGNYVFATRRRWAGAKEDFSQMSVMRGREMAGRRASLRLVCMRSPRFRGAILPNCPTMQSSCGEARASEGTWKSPPLSILSCVVAMHFQAGASRDFPQTTRRGMRVDRATSTFLSPGCEHAWLANSGAQATPSRVVRDMSQSGFRRRLPTRIGRRWVKSSDHPSRTR